LVLTEKVNCTFYVRYFTIQPIFNFLVLPETVVSRRAFILLSLRYIFRSSSSLNRSPRNLRPRIFILGNKWSRLTGAHITGGGGSSDIILQKGVIFYKGGHLTLA